MNTSFTFLLGAVLLTSSPLSTLVAQPHREPVTELSRQEKRFLNWYNLSPSKNKKYGADVERTYSDLLAGKKPKRKVVVAIVGTAADISHEDLHGKIWLNRKEIEGNGKDDDNNGYIDDINGWNFQGNAKGENVEYEKYEYARMYKKLLPEFGQVKSAADLPADKKAAYAMFKAVEKEFTEELKKQQQEKEEMTAFEKQFNEYESVIAAFLRKDVVTRKDIKNVKSDNFEVVKAQVWLTNKYDFGFTKEEFEREKKWNNESLTKHLNLDYNPRAIIGDNPYDLQDRNYGNNKITGPQPEHGTAVAGVIAGIRGNNAGVDGVADEVEVMVLRVTPQGDEYDKDVALAIRYAVDNGANIVNLNFGKDYSPQKEFVDDAVKYAAEKNVLIVHAAGNNGRDEDRRPNFPNPKFANGTRANNYLVVGASVMNMGKWFPAGFSDYGKTSVDLFAPGQEMVTLYPGNKLLLADATVLASAVVAGVAALVWSYYPELTAAELRNILLESTTKFPRTIVYKPGLVTENLEKADFAQLSATGGLVNAYEAMQMAEKTATQRAK